MIEAAKYSAMEALRDGREVEIRALRLDDEPELTRAFGRTSKQSAYRRFFGVKRSFTPQEKAFFVNVDFINHVALVAIATDRGGSVIAGGGRYVVVERGKAELAFMVVDEYQGQRIGSALLDHLAVIARAAGIAEFVADVLPDNTPMLQVFQKSGSCIEMKRTGGVVKVALDLNAGRLNRLRVPAAPSHDRKLGPS
jgi:GNAT superfamily N-acetyltransferase